MVDLISKIIKIYILLDAMIAFSKIFFWSWGGGGGVEGREKLYEKVRGKNLRNIFLK